MFNNKLKILDLMNTHSPSIFINQRQQNLIVEANVNYLALISIFTEELSEY